MLTAAKNQLKVTKLSIKYAVMREMLNKTTFVSNIIFMILNNACMIIQWIVLFSLKDNVGGYTFQQILLLWGMSSGVYGVAHFFFDKAFSLANTINSGKLDAYIVQPKNVLLSAITSNVSISAIGDIIFAFVMYFIYGFSLDTFILFIIFLITGGLILVAISVIFNSLSFWFNNTDMVADTVNSLMVNFATYPDGIFKGITKIILFTIIPVGIVNYIPIRILAEFNIYLFVINVGFCLLLILISFIIFYKGLKKYSSSNLMSARI